MYDNKQRQYIYNWREKNPEKYKEIQKRAVKKYQQKNKRKKAINNLNYYYKHRDEINKKRAEKRAKEKLDKMY